MNPETAKGTERNIKITLEYDGTDYVGWQFQPEGLRTIQGEVEQTLVEIVQHPIVLQGAGRTDKGVHAQGQVANFKTYLDIPVENLRRALNGKLPADISCLEVEDVPDDFNARFSAVGKHYRYTFYKNRWRSVFNYRTTSWLRGEFDLQRAQLASQFLEGTFDFKAFANQSKDPPETTERTVYKVNIHSEESLIFIDVIGRGFLYNMVRNIAGNLLEIARGKREPEWLKILLNQGERSDGGPTAEAKGLCLMAVFYDEKSLEGCLEKVSSL